MTQAGPEEAREAGQDRPDEHAQRASHLYNVLL